MRRGERLGSAALLALAGASAWLSYGALAVLDLSTTRIAALPPFWALIVLVIAGGAAGWLLRLRLSTLWPLTLTALLWLPWLPWPVPAAFLLWSGPIELIVWVGASGGVLAASAAGIGALASLARWASDPRRAVAVTIVIGTVSALIGVKAVGNRVPAGDEPHYLIIAQSLLLDGDVQIENNHQRHDYQSYFANLPRPDFLRRGVNGQIYSIHAPGLPALVAPAFAIDGYRGVVVFMAVLVAVGGALAWHTAWLLTRHAAAAWMAWFAVFFSAPVFFHTFTVYPDSAGAVMAMAGVWLLVRFETDPSPVPPRVLVAVGAALAILPWLHVRFAIVAGGLGLAIALRLLARAHRWTAAGAFLIVPVVSAAAWFAFFRIVYGSFSPASPYGTVVQNRLATLKPGLPGLFFDQQFGLFANAPIFVLACVGLISLARRHRRFVLELALVAIPYVLAVGSFVMWWAGHSAPGRFLLVLLLPAAVLVAWLYQEAPALWARTAIVAAALMGWAYVAIRTTVNTGVLLYNSRDGYDLLLDWLSPTVNLPLALPSFHRDVVPVAVRDSLVWTMALAVALAIVWLIFRLRPHASRGAAWALGGSVLALTVMVAATLVWMRYERAVVTPSTSQLAFLQEWDPDWHPIEVQLTPLAWLTHDDVLPRIELETTTRGPAVPAATRPLLTVPLVPAGEYDIVASTGARLAGALDVSVGRSTQTIEHFDLTNRPPGITGLVLRLPVLVHSITIRGDATAAAVVTHVSLRPRRVLAPSDRVANTYARRASRYGAARTFFLDEFPFMEVPGFWTQGGASTDVVVDSDADAPPPMLLRAGAVPTQVSLSDGAWRADYALTPGQVQTVSLPGPGAVHHLAIATSAAFRPADIDPKSSDLRELGVWIEFPH